ncbi:methyltransferase domain-containing protein [Paenibacillus sp. VCA1]|uniref:class I SAM-dependent methyltransferase n=1 Tax=Paenibacillus sp. VCA1 TaxID=3039148 RepID=UPI002871E244|nr:methyltransferase domain-containing protein [Paenibacillus sp. VCA1]MDR9857254.1 methyltransferase domain-containing protein [Paenibacillus sp. VCA1]
MESMNQWKPLDYDRKLGFVSEYGKDLLSLLNPQKHETILDLGCGTGDLTSEIAASGAEVIGLDASSAMIERARAKYPEISFRTGDAQRFDTDRLYDAVFSNAALHWMKNAENAAQSVIQALKPGGRFVAEFGGAGNVGAIVRAIVGVLTRDYGIDAAARNPWYFPTPAEYAALLERQGFIVRLLVYFDRPTKLPDGQKGMLSWLSQFGGPFFAGLTAEQIGDACGKISREVLGSLWKDGAVYADYKRLRVVAEKPAAAN